jgi:hypothetical protein
MRCLSHTGNYERTPPKVAHRRPQPSGPVTRLDLHKARSGFVVGEQMKTKSTWVYVAGAAVACAGIIGVSTLAANAGTQSNVADQGGLAFGAPASAPASASASADPSAKPTPADPSRPADPASDSNPPALGKVVKTGIGKWVLYGVAIHEKSLPKISFGVMAGTQSADGKLNGQVETNETTGSAKSAGFHGVEGSMGLDAGKSPTFGYYVGPVTKITGVVGGKTVTAGEAAWSEDSSVHFFWFAGSGSVGKLAAFDKAGHRLPTGHSSVSVG